MERRPQELVDELRRAIAQTPDSAEQEALFAKLAVLEVQLAELARRQLAVQEADLQLTEADKALLGWRVVIGILLAALVGLSGWLVASIWQAL
jgi:hypothetical protein